MRYDDLLKQSPYTLEREDKKQLLESLMNPLTRYHREHCQEYGRIVTALGYRGEPLPLEAIPFIPVALFKTMTLKSREDGLNPMVSSGTTSQQCSTVFLDEQNAGWQQQTLINIVADFIGNRRIPMLILDSPGVLRKRAAFSARGAGILGFSIFGSPVCYALNEDMTLNEAAVMEFASHYREGPVLLFGFTALVWEYVYKVLRRQKLNLDFKQGYLIHGGGWKKLADQQVSSVIYRRELERVFGAVTIINYYGMIEQTGSIYMACPEGHLHASIYSEIYIRRPVDFSLCEKGEEGLIQVLSPMAVAYPGHSVLTEDLGVLLGEDDCPCGRKGKYFKVLGRLPKAEVRGCSDTYEF
ncbi:Acyl-protein synthetase, LuxE [Eubacterium aggregans]|uniref:Acyl-protein synthetase, LuxE n=1 Tax=Eubacterium aggregans TaxID=81409 RepID=A0A1H3WT98_9FIRM|nr:acyl-protein synthetase [Eubacterium aggregans]SDZ90387.1 Acyl-protein synthetase, LuxE [Eubacterium aggregans]